MANTAQLAPLPLFKAFDNNGLPLAYGYLYSYQAGTATPQATYPGPSEVTPNANPTQLNFRGEAGIWLDPGSTYKLNLTDVNGNQIPGWPIDNIPGGQLLTQASIGALLWPETTAESGAGVTIENYAIPNDTGLARSRRYSASNTWDYRSDQRLFEIYLSKYGAVFNGSSDDSAAIGDALAAMFALVGSNGPRKVIMPEGGLTASIQTAGAITLYCGALGVDFNGLILNASTVTSGNIFTVTGRGAAPYSRYASSAPIENFQLIGPSSGSASTVMLNLTGETPESGEISNGFIRDFSIYGGNYGIQINNGVYILSIRNGVIENQLTYGIYYPGGSDAGENISLYGCSIAGVATSGAAIAIPSGYPDQELYCYGCSLDYNGQAFDLASGYVELHSCHIESNNTALPFFSLSHGNSDDDATVFRMFGGTIAITSASGLAALFSVNASGNMTIIDLDTMIQNYELTTQLLDVTAGSNYAFFSRGTRINGYGWPTLNGLPFIYNGGFEADSTAGWTAVGSGVTWSVGSGNPHSGSYALEGTAATAASAAQYQVLPVRPGQTVCISAWTDVTVYTEGNVNLSAYYFQDAALDTQISGEAFATYTATTGGYVQSSYESAAPVGANYLRIQLATNGFEGTAYFDDITVGIF